MKKFQVRIEKMAYQGQGVGYFENKVVFVPDAVEGDHLWVEVVEEKKNFLNAKILEEVAFNPLRQASPCSVSKECGGCQWLEVPYAKQIEWKKKFVEDALVRIGGIKELPEMGMVPSKLPLSYRYRITLRGTITESGVVKVGFFRKESHEQVHTRDCKIASPVLSRIMEKISLFSFFKGTVSSPLAPLPLKFRLELQEIPYDGKVLVTIFPVGQNPVFEELKQRLKEFHEISWVGFVQDRKDVEALVYEEHEGISYFTKPGMFQQINPENNLTLRNLVKEAVSAVSPRKILDLYSGAGNLSLGLAKEGREIFGTDYDQTSISCANHAVKLNKLPNIQYVSGDAERILKDLVREGKTFDCVIADPPRQGMGNILPLVLQLKPTDLFLVSCDPSTLARDLKSFLPSYRIHKVVGLDFFPQTFHVETFISLRYQPS